MTSKDWGEANRNPMVRAFGKKKGVKAKCKSCAFGKYVDQMYCCSYRIITEHEPGFIACSKYKNRKDLKKMKGTIAVIGGSQHAALKKLANTMGYALLFDNAKNAKRSRYRSIASKADSIVVMTEACSHKAMWLIKSLSKELDVPITYVRSGFGVTRAIYQGVLAIEKYKRSLKRSKEELETKQAKVTLITKSGLVFGQTLKGEHVLFDDSICKFPKVLGVLVEGTVEHNVMTVKRNLQEVDVAVVKKGAVQHG